MSPSLPAFSALLAAAVAATAAGGQATSAAALVARCAAGANAAPGFCEGALDTLGASVSLLQREGAAGARALRVAPAGAELEPHTEEAQAPLPETSCGAEDFAGRDIDLIIYGATGFTGQLASKYLAKDHPDKPRWAIGGRHRDELEELQANLSALGTNAPSIIIADLQDPASLQAMTRRAKAIVSYAGPYHKYGGENLIRSAIATCTHYADLCGESAFKKEMLQKYGDAAKARGVAIVQALGMDSLPADLLAMGAAEQLATDGHGPPTDITVYFSVLNSWFSGGTMAAGKEQLEVYGVDPNDKESAYALAPEESIEARVDQTPGGTPPHTGASSSDIGYDANFSSITLPYAMSACDGPTVRRSLALTFPDAPIHFAEVMGSSVLKELATFLSSPEALSQPPNPNPVPGEGPPQWLLEGGSLIGQGLAARGAPNAAQARLHMHCKGDPAYQNTAKWSAELALALAQEGPKGGVGGYLTPTVALGSEFIMQRLSKAESGNLCSFWWGSDPKNS